MTPLALTTAQSRRVKAGSTLIVVPVEPQPPSPADLYEYCGDENNNGRHYWRCNYEWERYWIREQPCRVGEPLLLSEPWAVSEELDATRSSDITHRVPIAYRADDDCPGIGWRPASEMLAWAVRLKPRCKSVGVKRLGEIGNEEAVAWGFAGRCMQWVWVIGHERIA